MGFLDPRPTEAYLHVARKPVDATCPACASRDVRRYPVVAALGPRIVTKCQDCFHVLALDRPRPEDDWPPFRAVAYDWPSSRAG